MAKKRTSPQTRAKSLPVKEQIAIARDRAITTTIAIFLTVLLDKEHADQEIIQRVWREVNELSESIREGRVNGQDLMRVLREEYEINIK